jgi:hypothetical protein
MKTPRGFFKPLAIGAPTPYRELPVRVERMIHFVPPHLDKVRAKVGEMAKGVDVILANLEDAIPADAKDAALAGTIEMGQTVDFAGMGVGFWVRINCINSPWHLFPRSKAPGTSSISTNFWPLSKPSTESRSRSCCTPSLRPPRASTISRPSPPRRRACRVSASARQTWPPAAA